MSTLKVNTLEEATVGGATFYTAKAWVNFNGTGTVAIRASGNVSSVTDNGTGLYTVALSNAMSAITFGYALSGRSNQSSHLTTDVSQRYNTNNTTSNLYIGAGENGGNNSAGRYNDPSIVSATVLE